MKTKQSFAYECCLYIGSREGYNGPFFTKKELFDKIKSFQENNEFLRHPVRITECTFLCTHSYEENGYEISAITYPNSNKNQEEIRDFMTALALDLISHFKQNRITIISKILPTI